MREKQQTRTTYLALVEFYVACSVFGRLLACVKGAVILLESGE